MGLVCRYLGRFVAVASLPILAACGETNPAAELQRKAANFDTISSAVTALPVSNPASIPTSGTASFTGASGLYFQTASNQEYIMFGDAKMLADFQNRVVSGTLDNFTGGVLPVGGGLVPDPGNFSGAFVLMNGQIFPASSSFIAGYGGTLTDGTVVVDIQGRVDGQFGGNPISGVGAFDNGTSAGTINGSPVFNIQLEFWAQ